MHRCDGPVVRASASRSESRGFESWPSHTKDFKKWHSLPSRLALDKCERSREIKHAELPVGQLPAVAFTAFADAWPRATETEIGATLCTIGAGRTWTFDLTMSLLTNFDKFQSPIYGGPQLLRQNTETHEQPILSFSRPFVFRISVKDIVKCCIVS